MLRVYWILLFNLLFATDVIFGQYCISTRDSFQAYNIGRNIFVGQGAIAIWRFNTDTNQVYDQRLSLKDVYGENTFEWVDTAFIFNFDKCSPKQNRHFCETIDKARNIVMAIGQKKQETGSRRYGYLAYRMNPDGSLKRIDQNRIVWDLSNSGTLSGNFWVSLPGDLYYESSVFVVSRLELFVSVYDTSSNSDSKYHLMSRKLDKNGKWAKNWVEVSKIGFRGMFDVRGRVFGMDRKNMVYEFDWSKGNVTFNKISNMKELLNCFGNSTLVETITKPTDPITEETSTITSTEQADTLITLETTDQQVMTITLNTTDQLIMTTTLSTTDQQIMTTTINITDPIAEEAKREEEPMIWSFVLLIGVILLLTIIILVLIIIYRKKTKSQIIYLNSTPTQTRKSKSSQSTTLLKTIRPKQV